MLCSIESLQNLDLKQPSALGSPTFYVTCIGKPQRTLDDALSSIRLREVIVFPCLTLYDGRASVLPLTHVFVHPQPISACEVTEFLLESSRWWLHGHLHRQTPISSREVYTKNQVEDRRDMTSSYQPSNSFSPSEMATAPNRPVSDLPQAQVDAIIRTKRKAREPKACYPCHARKVKCDRNLPCDGCVKRDHAELCSYERPSKKRAQDHNESPVGGTSIGSAMEQPAYSFDDNATYLTQEHFSSRANGSNAWGRVSIAREEWDNVRNRLREMESTISSLRVGLERAEEGPTGTMDAVSEQSGDADSGSKGASPEREGILAANTLGQGSVHLGSRSALAYILNNKAGSDQLQALLEGGILPKLGLDNESATYPFVDLWSADMSTFDISAVYSTLPADDQCRK